MSCAQCASPQVVKQLLERDLPLTVPPTMAVRPRIALSNSEPACACAPRLAHLHSRHTLAGWLAVYGGGGMHLHAMQPNGTKNNNDADDAMADVNVSSSFIYLYVCVCVVLCCAVWVRTRKSMCARAHCRRRRRRRRCRRARAHLAVLHVPEPCRAVRHPHKHFVPANN